MGNSRSLNCTAQQPLYISEFEDNLEALEAATDKLIDLRNDLMTLNYQLTPEMVEFDQLRWWLSKTETTISQVTGMIERAKEEREKSSYILGKSLAQSLKRVVAFKDTANFKELVIDELAKRLQSDLETLKITREQLLVLKEDVKQGNALEERPERRPLIQDELWLSMVETTILEADELLRDGPQEVREFYRGDIMDHTFVGKVASILGAMFSLISEGNSSEVVGSAPSRPYYICELQDDLKQLKSKTVKLWALKEDTEKRVLLESGGQQKKPLQQVQLWLSNAVVMITEADKLVENAMLEMKNLYLGDFSNYKMLVQNVGRLLNDAIVLIANGDFRYVVERTSPECVDGRIHELTVGTESMLEEAWNFLQLDANYHGNIIGIAGICGVGKTNLLTQIHNKLANTPNDFDVVISVVVSKHWQLDNIVDDIWKQLGICDEKWLKRSFFYEKVSDLHFVMQKVKFVLLLDDVYEKFNLQHIGVPSTLYGSKIFIASHSIEVCNAMGAREMIIRVEPLKAEDAWHLFHKKIGDIDADVLPLARKVAEECCGMPIVLIAVGGVMASRRSFEEWKHALMVIQRLTSNSQDFEDKVYQLLKFSYDCLPIKKVQSCFLYCSLFPDSFKILKNDLVHYWICEKFCCLDEGYFILSTLIRRDLLEEEGNYVKMHALLHNVALWIAEECEKEKHKFFARAGCQLTKVPASVEWEGAMTVSLMANSLKNFWAVGDCCDVLTLFLSHNPFLHSIRKDSFLSMDKLTVLDLSKTIIEEVPAEVSGLQFLKYLNLSHTRIRELPRMLILLTKLEYLNLDHIANIQMIPTQLLSNLSELRVLKMFQCGSMAYCNVQDNLLANGNLLIQELLCLQNLVELSITIRNDHDFNNFCREPRLLNCTRALVLQVCRTKGSLNISSLANAKQLNSLLMFGNISIKELIVNVTEPRVASGLTNNQLIYSSLEEVVVSNYNGMRELTWLILAPNLTVLRVTCNDYMEEIISPAKFGKLQDGDKSSNLFPKLQVLELYGLPKLKTIYWKASSFPCLRQIDVYDCPGLKMLPLNCSSVMGCKVVIKGEESWWRYLKWEDDATQAAFSSCFQKVAERQSK